LEENNIKVYPDINNHDIDEEEIENNKIISVRWIVVDPGSTSFGSSKLLIKSV